MTKMILNTLAVVSVSALTTVAMACPDLQGSFKCQYKTVDLDVNVNQTAERGSAIYAVEYGLGNVTIYTDGQEHTIASLPPLDVYASEFKYKAACQGDKVSATGLGKMRNGNGTATLKGTLEKKGDKVQIEFTVTTDKKHDIKLACVKK